MFTLKERIKFWFIRTFKTRNCWIPKDAATFTWIGEDTNE